MDSEKISDSIEVINCSSWPELVTYLKRNDNLPRIYRGQSNGYRTELIKDPNREYSSFTISYPVRWKLISSFDRFYKGSFYKFRSYLYQQLEDNLFISKYGSYDIVKEYKLNCYKQLERIYFLQHYGVRTCFMDFTHDPLTALYFAITDVRSTDIYTPDNNGNKIVHPSEPFISCYELDYKRIIELFKIQKLDKNFSSLDYSRYRVKHSHTHLGFDLTPTENCDPDNINENLRRQKGCFVLYDNNGSDFALDKTIDDLFFYGNLGKEKVIKEFRLPYNEIFAKPDFEGMEGISLYRYLKSKKICGKYLFSDIQGLKYDLNFFHDDFPKI